MNLYSNPARDSGHMPALDMFELPGRSDECLFSRVSYLLSRFPRLLQIYDQELLRKLVKGKHDYDNYLLWLLASNDSHALDTLGRIDSMLEDLDDEDALNKFQMKLRSRGEVQLKSYLTELEFASYFKKRGCSVRLEPSPGVDFSVTYKHLEVCFDAKYLFPEELQRQHKLNSMIWVRFRRTREPFIFTLVIRRTLKAADVANLFKLVQGSLQGFDKSAPLPLTIRLPSETDPMAEVTVLRQVDKRGYLGGLTSVGWGACSKTIRSKLRSKANKLPKGRPGVIILKRGTMWLSKDTVEDALFGDEIAHINTATHDVTWTRGGDRFFRPRINTRVSAVCYSDRMRSDGDLSYQIQVYHNPFAEVPLPSELFANANVRQLVPNHETGKMRWI
jgi:hypothetical protein